MDMKNHDAGMQEMMGMMDEMMQRMSEMKAKMQAMMGGSADQQVAAGYAKARGKPGMGGMGGM